MRRLIRYVVPCSSRSLALALSAIAIASVSANAKEDWPTSTITWVVPYPAGGSTDVLARVVAPRLSELLGQPVVVENRAGAGGNVGTGYVAQQVDDNHVLLMGNIGPISVSPTLYSDLPYDPVADLAPVRLLMNIPNILLVTNSFSAETMDKFVDAARDEDPPYAYATPGTGTSPHLAAELFSISTGVELLHVPYSGSAPALIDTVAGHVHVMFDNLPSAIPFVRSGQLRAIAVTTAERLEELPEVPTFAESGLEGYEVVGWSGVLVPADTPDYVIHILSDAFEQIMELPEVQEQIGALGGQIPQSDPESFRSFIQSEIEKWGEVVRTARITID